ncbi:hypothetical protein BDV96DRAFT_305705 [Lophiotrema nucula]|uniref:Uncharacterized protein n=1 Tax=Lophiotrema nucula TaxID=690887 RepID=A0A6A5YJI4_9PLEO|nr:hypothetical protein BDV96DRAFT_305705 [Lophiotrema nucula]
MTVQAEPRSFDPTSASASEPYLMTLRRLNQQRLSPPLLESWSVSSYIQGPARYDVLPSTSQAKIDMQGPASSRQPTTTATLDASTKVYHETRYRTARSTTDYWVTAVKRLEPTVAKALSLSALPPPCHAMANVTVGQEPVFDTWLLESGRRK